MQDLRMAVALACFCWCSLPCVWADAAEEPCVSTFCCDITPPLGQPLAACDAIRTVEQPLLAKGIVLKAGGQRYVLCARLVRAVQRGA